MERFSDILLAVDFDHTLTGPEGTIPERNIEAIAYFTANGGKFTVNTGRSIGTFWRHLDTVPANAPLLLYNGSAAWEKGTLTHSVPIELDVWQTMDTLHRLFPDINLEIQGVQCHYLVEPQPEFVALYEKLRWKYRIAQWGEDVGPFLKFALWDTPQEGKLSSMYTATQAQVQRFREIALTLHKLYGDKISMCRPAPRIIDVQAKGVSKLAAAKRLQKALGRRLLVCVGDGENDIPMLDGADYAFCPADGVVANRYKNVCCCAEGAVAEVIYEKIPEILAIQP